MQITNLKVKAETWKRGSEAANPKSDFVRENSTACCANIKQVFFLAAKLYHHSQYIAMVDSPIINIGLIVNQLADRLLSGTQSCIIEIVGYRWYSEKF